MYGGVVVVVVVVVGVVVGVVVLVADTTLLHLFVLTHISFISTATFIKLRSTITKVILIPVVWVSHIHCYRVL